MGAFVSRFHSISGMAARRPPALEPAVWGGAPTPYPDVRPRRPLGGGLRLVRRGGTLSQRLRLSVRLLLGAEKALRRTEIERAGVAAANIPLKNAKNAARVLEIALLLRGKSNPNASSDLVCGDRLAAFAVHGALLNVEANLPLIKTPSLLEPFQQALKEYRELLERK